MRVISTIALILLSTVDLFGQQNCLDFDGSNDFVLIGDVNDLGTSNFTIEAWVNCETTAGIGQFVLCKGITSAGTPSNAGYGLRVNDQNANDINFFVGGVGAIETITAYGLTTNNWHHLAGVRDGLNMYLYLDGNLIGIATTPSVYNTNTNINLAIGAHNKNSITPTAEFFNGKIDEVRIWNVARSQTQIQNDMYNTFCQLPTGLIAYYPLNQGFASMNNVLMTTAYDYSGYGNDGSVFNFQLTGPNSNWVTGVPTTPTTTPVGNQTIELCQGESYTFGSNVYTTSGVYTDTLYSASYMGCDSVVNTTINVHEPNANFYVMGQGFYANDTTQDSYQWIECGGMTAISGANNSNYSPTQNGSYALVTEVGGCYDTSCCVSIVLTDLGIDNYELGSLLLYPNPTKEQLTIEFGETFETVKIRVLDVHGKVVQEIHQQHTNHVTFNLEGPSGIYFLELQSDDRHVRFRVMKE